MKTVNADLLAARRIRERARVEAWRVRAALSGWCLECHSAAMPGRSRCEKHLILQRRYAKYAKKGEMR